MLSAKADEKNIVTGLTAGVDDYMTKPFSPRELVARVNAVLRRTSFNEQTKPVSVDADLLVAGDLTIDENNHKVTLNQKPVNLGPTEYRLLVFLISNQNRAFTRAQLINHCAKNKQDVDERSMDVYIRRLRQSLKSGDYHRCIKTVHGFGYRFTLPE